MGLPHRHFNYICIYLYKNTSLHSFVLLMTIEDRYLSYTGCNDVNVGTTTLSVSPVGLWVGGKLGWKAKVISAYDWPFSIVFCSCAVEFLPPRFVYMVVKKGNEAPLISGSTTLLNRISLYPPEYLRTTMHPGSTKKLDANHNSLLSVRFQGL